MKRTTFFVIFILVLNSLICAQDNIETNMFKLDLAKNALKAKKYSQALLYVQEVTEELRLVQKKMVTAFFPAQIEGFIYEEDANYQIGTFENQTADSDILFSRQYIKNTETHTSSIDGNVVFSDPSIQEYIALVNKPELLQNLQDDSLQTSIIKVNEVYAALEKISEDEKYYERNIVVNENTLLNVIGHDLESSEALDLFCQKINIVGLDNFLKN